MDAHPDPSLTDAMEAVADQRFLRAVQSLGVCRRGRLDKNRAGSALP